MNCTLPPTFLKGFEVEKNPFLVLEDRLYTVHKSHNGSDNNLSFFGRKFGLRESELISLFEEEFYQRNKGLIDRLMDMARVKAEKSEKRLSSTQESSIERFLLIDVFDAFLNLYKVRKGQKTKTILDNSSYLTIGNLRAGDISILQSLIEGYILSLPPNVFRLGLANNEDAKNYVSFNGKRYNISYYCSLSSLEESYKQRLESHIMDVTSHHCSRLASIAEDNRKRLEEKKRYLERRGNKTFDLSYDKINEGHRTSHRLSIEIPPFILKKEQHHYLFEKPITAAVDIKVTPTTIHLTGPANVISLPCHHPFVHGPDSWEPEGTVCYDGEERFYDEGITFQAQDISDLDKALFAQQIAYVLDQARTNIEYGYRGNITPVNSLSPDTFQNEHLRDGISYAHSKIRLCDNNINA